MKLCFGIALLSVCALAADTPNLTGVWKADPQKSNMGRPTSGDTIAILDQNGGKLKVLIGQYGPRGEQRMSYTYNIDGKDSYNTIGGLPTKSTASWNGNTLVVDSKVAGPRGGTTHDEFTVSPDGNTLTMERAGTLNGREFKQTVVLNKQPDSAGEPLRKPEQTAGAHFKNVQTMKDVPASQFIDAMRSFSFSLGVDCEHCHVQGNFASDDKPTKGMARKMIVMTHGINEQTFGRKMEVRCYTCHRGQAEPQSRPAL